jgi:hypothetical protein
LLTFLYNTVTRVDYALRSCVQCTLAIAIDGHEVESHQHVVKNGIDEVKNIFYSMHLPAEVHIVPPGSSAVGDMLRNLARI